MLLPPGLKRPHAQVYRQCQRGYWRASKRWCKALPPEGVNKALLRFANNEAGLRPVDVYGGARGAIAQLRELEAWFQARGRPRRAGSCAPGFSRVRVNAMVIWAPCPAWSLSPCYCIRGPPSSQSRVSGLRLEVPIEELSCSA